MEFFDSHSHYNDEKFDEDRESLINDIYKEGITKILCVGYNVETSKQAIEIAENHSFIYASVGISPNDLGNIDNVGTDSISARAYMQCASTNNKRAGESFKSCCHRGNRIR